MSSEQQQASSSSNGRRRGGLDLVEQAERLSSPSSSSQTATAPKDASARLGEDGGRPRAEAALRRPRPSCSWSPRGGTRRELYRRRAAEVVVAVAVLAVEMCLCVALGRAGERRRDDEDARAGDGAGARLLERGYRELVKLRRGCGERSASCCRLIRRGLGSSRQRGRRRLGSSAVHPTPSPLQSWCR